MAEGAVNDKINVFVKLDMNANKGASFHVSRDETVQELIKLIKDKEGPQVADVFLIRGAKPMRVKNNNGGLCKLSDYDCYNNCTIIASLRLLGGAQAAPEEGVKFKSFDTKAVEKLGGTLAISGKADDGSIMYKDCVYGLSDGCAESKCPKATFGCSCVLCADCTSMLINHQLNAGGVKLHCASKQCTKTDVCPLLLYTIAAYTDDEKSAADVKLSENNFQRTKHQNCWHEYDAVGTINQLIGTGSMRKISGKDCWDTRLCPNPACVAVNANMYENCRHQKCHLCGTQYCHFCLGLWDKPNGCGWNNECAVKPMQVINKSDLPK